MKRFAPTGTLWNYSRPINSPESNLSDVLWQKANTYRQSGRSTDAIVAYLELQRLHPDDTTIVSLLGELYLKVRDYPAAVSAFQKVYTALPTDKQAQHNLIASYQQYAQALRNRRDYSAAVVQLQKAVNLFPTDINLRLSLSQAYQHVGRYEQARDELEQILVRDPEQYKRKDRTCEPSDPPWKYPHESEKIRRSHRRL